MFDLAHWESLCPLGDDRGEIHLVDSPASLARWEQALRLASTQLDLGPSTAADLFVWSSRPRDGFAPGKEALTQYASQWPQAGVEFRKQYVIIQDAP